MAKPADAHPAQTLPQRLELAVDRDADLPVGVQIRWAIRAKIADGTLAPGERLPGLRELAEEAGVNVNTVRAVYQRLEQDGLTRTLHGSGTFVAAAGQLSRAAGAIAASAAQEAHDSGVDPRDVAAALYGASEATVLEEPDATRRRELLRRQIAALEQSIAEIEVGRQALTAKSSSRWVDGPRLLGLEELEQVRHELLERLVELTLPDDPPSNQPPSSGTRQAAEPGSTRAHGTSRAKRRSRNPPRTAPAS